MLCRLSAPLQLRLLTALCNDTLEGGNMRAELAGRVDQIAALHSERHQTLLEVLDRVTCCCGGSPSPYVCKSWMCNVPA